MSKPMDGIFIEVSVDEALAGDAELAARLEEVCPVDIFRAGSAGVEVLASNQDECVLCNLCLEAAPEGAIRITKLYEG